MVSSELPCMAALLQSPLYRDRGSSGRFSVFPLIVEAGVSGTSVVVSDRFACVLDLDLAAFKVSRCSPSTDQSATDPNPKTQTQNHPDRQGVNQQPTLTMTSKSRSQTETTTALRAYDLRALVIPSLILRDFAQDGWSGIARRELSDSEAAFFTDLQRFLPPTPALNLDSILLISAKHGVLEKVWGPILCQDGGRLVLQLGGNVFPVTQTGNTFICGQLTGQLAFTPTRFAVRNADVCCQWRSEQDAIAYLFTVGVSLDLVQAGLDTKLQAVLDGTADLLPLLKPRSVKLIGLLDLIQQGQTLRPLPVTFALLGVSQQQGRPGQADYYCLHLTDGRVVRAEGNTEALLKSGWRP